VYHVSLLDYTFKKTRCRSCEVNGWAGGVAGSDGACGSKLGVLLFVLMTVAGAG
jgi:hypothetical protein